MKNNQNTLHTKSIIARSGKLNKEKINLVSGAITQLFAELVYATTAEDMDTINV